MSPHLVLPWWYHQSTTLCHHGLPPWWYHQPTSLGLPPRCTTMVVPAYHIVPPWLCHLGLPPRCTTTRCTATVCHHGGTITRYATTLCPFSFPPHFATSVCHPKLYHNTLCHHGLPPGCDQLMSNAEQQLFANFATTESSGVQMCNFIAFKLCFRSGGNRISDGLYIELYFTQRSV